MAKKVIIVGGVAGGATAAARLRRLDEKVEIILLERGEYISFANCGLPYYIGGEIKEKSALTLQTPESFRARFNVDVRIQHEATAIDRTAKRISILDRKTGQSYEENFDSLILSMGAEPVRPPLPGIDARRVFTLRNIPDTFRIKDFIDREKPKSAAVIGGGYIGMEMAENLHAAGLKVTIIEMLDQVIAPIDYDMACEVHSHIRGKGVDLMLGCGVKAITEKDVSGGLVVSVKKGEDVSELSVDMAIMAVGVRPESGIAKAAGLDTNQRGAIIVDSRMRTLVNGAAEEHIFAVGDAVEITDFVSGQKGMIPLAGPANKQGRIAADNICGIPSEYTGTQGSAILKVFDLTVASTGINEKTAQRLGMAYDKSFTYSAAHASYYPGAVNMTVKTLFCPKTGKILGAQIVGYDGVDKRCDVIAAAIRFGAAASDLAKLELCYAPPYSSAKDPVNMAGFVIENILADKVKNFHWHDVEKLPKDGSVILLDTRSRTEFENGSIPGFINIPLDELRGRLGELAGTPSAEKKKIYVTCQVGLRGYVACRILSQSGYECYNLSGGYRLYRTIFGTNDDSSEGQNGSGKSVALNPETQLPESAGTGKLIRLDTCGLQCPGPIVKLGAALKEAESGDIIVITSTDPAFAGDIEGFCRRTGHIFGGLSSAGGINTARIIKGDAGEKHGGGNNKNFIVFSGDLDKAIASFIMANAAAAMGRRVSMFFTFWGLNILRRNERVRVRKDLISRLFSAMMPKSSQKLGLSRMNMGGLGAKMIRSVMRNKNIDSLETLIQSATDNGVELVACAMSMDVMGLKIEELVPGVKTSGAASMLAFAEESDMSLFI
jgi:NADPH-dependent 2,4-dienoyl-CoA reductase/sulfur reductase-like enzyme/peroxiredoxin family protein/rhodanese-related sulfurtransferase/TusA-related sulfurtransferase